MALSLLSQNRCSFGGCQLYFANTDDLIAHIEFTHITYQFRLFRMPYNPQPCAPDVVRITFNHYRKRQLDYCILELRMVWFCKKIFCVVSLLQTDLEVVFHLKTNPFLSQSVLPNTQRLSSIVLRLLYVPFNISPFSHIFLSIRLVGISRSRPYKCHQCSKRYKTTAGLSNHVDQSHRKQPASPSPAVLDQLISQARAHGQATAAAQEQQVCLLLVHFIIYYVLMMCC
ncbi:unnamed protein product [Angiostrongylus costaricensis]|uniref:C2H2-type domain-containing protein n=1 Tax=Angiostrongylus costaricensis TaxID=334426 RepID=A0A0R3PBT6_ANGCS|nr:unnamed protein product [Angiostrongylus costaricensis]